MWLWVECTLFGIYKAGRIVYATYDCILLKAKFLFTLPMVVLTFALIYSHLKSPREKVEIWMVFTNFLIFFHQLSWELLIDWNKRAIYQLSWNQNLFFRSGTTYDLWQVDMMQFILKTGLFVVIEHSVSKYKQERTISGKL